MGRHGEVPTLNLRLRIEGIYWRAWQAAREGREARSKSELGFRETTAGKRRPGHHLPFSGHMQRRQPIIIGNFRDPSRLAHDPPLPPAGSPKPAGRGRGHVRGAQHGAWGSGETVGHAME